MSERGKGTLCIVASAFGFALMAFFVRLCDDFGGPVSSFQKSLFRNLIALVIAAAVFCRFRRREPRPDAVCRLPLKAWLLLLGRSVSGCLGIFGNFYALSHIPISEAMTLNKTAPFFTVLLSWMFIKEKAGFRQMAWLVLAFVGAMLVMKPGFRGEETFATLCALGGGLGAGVAYACVRELGILKVESSFVVLFFSAFSSLASLPFMASAVDPMTWRQMMIMLGAGCGAAIGQFGVTAAYRYAAPREIAVYDYTSVIFTALFGFCFFDQVPDLLSVAGFMLIVLAGLRSSRNPPNKGCRGPVRML